MLTSNGVQGDNKGDNKTLTRQTNSHKPCECCCFQLELKELITQNVVGKIEFVTATVCLPIFVIRWNTSSYSPYLANQVDLHNTDSLLKPHLVRVSLSVLTTISFVPKCSGFDLCLSGKKQDLEVSAANI